MTMTPAEFKTVRESLNLSGRDMANILGLKSDRTIRFWESGRSPVPDGAAAVLIGIDTAVKHAVDRAVEREVEAIDEINRVPVSTGKTTIYRYRDDGQFARLDPENYEALHYAKVHHAMIARLRVTLRRLGVRGEIVYPPDDA